MGIQIVSRPPTPKQGLKTVSPSDTNHDDVLPELSNAKVFTKVDFSNGYWQVKLDDDSSNLTTFNTPFGRFKWKRMPFGISPAGEIFQQRLDQAIDCLDGVQTVADDI